MSLSTHRAGLLALGFLWSAHALATDPTAESYQTQDQTQYNSSEAGANSNSYSNAGADSTSIGQASSYQTSENSNYVSPTANAVNDGSSTASSTSSTGDSRSSSNARTGDSTSTATGVATSGDSLSSASSGPSSAVSGDSVSNSTSAGGSATGGYSSAGASSTGGTGGQAAATGGGGGSASANAGDSNSGGNTIRVSSVYKQVRQTAQANAAAGVSTASCVVDQRVGFSLPGFGISGGRGKIDPDCALLARADIEQDRGALEAAVALRCATQMYSKALGADCPKILKIQAIDPATYVTHDENAQRFDEMESRIDRMFKRSLSK